MEWFGVASYGIAAAVYGITTAVLIASHPGGRSGTVVILATGTSTFWAAGMAFFLVRPVPLAAVVALDALLVLVWTACALSWLGRSPGRISVKTLLLTASAVFGVWSVIAAAAAGPSTVVQSVYLTLLCMSLVGLLAVEQLFRNTVEQQREFIRLLCLGIGGLFVVNAFIYSQASLLGSVVPVFWEGRGLACAAAAPLVVTALKRLSQWERELFVSRQVVFYTASLVAVGAYLLAMGTVAYVILALGGQWGVLLQSLFLIAALAMLASVLFSTKIRARAKVLLVKHFYKNKYDYREEWLRLTEELGRTGESRGLARNALHGIARIVGSDGGSLWMSTDGKRYERIVSLDADSDPVEAFASTHPMVAFLASSAWVIDSDQYRREPQRYRSAFGDPEAGGLPAASLIVPLDRRGFLQGFVVLPKPRGLGDLNFEDHDILKTAGRQVAGVLAQALAQEQLAATQQFEAVNKLSTFLMHDLKNVVAQQELVVSNARRFKHRPEFIDDAIRTIDAGAQRMRSILNRLENARAEHTERVDLAKLILDVCEQCSDRLPRPQFVTDVQDFRLDVDRDRIAMAVTHAIRNAQDATDPDGCIDARLAVGEDTVIIEVQDTGAGMTAEFVRDRLFKPFDSTKGAKGMGIGAYQIRETFAAAGGDVEIDSEPGRGTSFRMILPIDQGRVPSRSVA